MRFSSCWSNERIFGFKDLDGALEGFYSVIVDGLTNLPNEETKIELLNETMNLQYKREMNISSVKMKISYNNGEEGGTTVWLSKKIIEKLLGKL
ncbi:hypothetical protein [Flavobacterium sp.]|uniref:hypothetical protein n=1 Tax=Flavobacterium sp. TaxID=239 RepID=UPI002486EFD9|nr:hypothetical protein [Flavobacterium sp.]MDI1316275.1 hypothetical protein [Flavobacterium sp.]